MKPRGKLAYSLERVPPADTRFILKEKIMRIPLHRRVFILGAAVTSVLGLSLAVPATAGAAPSAQAVRAQATVVVPNVVGENVGVAIHDLQVGGFGLGFKQYKDNACDYGKYEVIRQSPAAGSFVDAGSVVTLTFAVRPAPPRVCP
jgi:hypothetical protein